MKLTPDVYFWVTFEVKSFLEETRGQFNQHFTRSFYTQRSQKHKKTLTTWLSFLLLGSAPVKAVCKHVGKITSSIKPSRQITPSVNFISILGVNFGAIFWRQELQSWNVTRESCSKHFCLKNLRTKCWWNWPQNCQNPWYALNMPLQSTSVSRI